jgi:hypothetical protein
MNMRVIRKISLGSAFTMGAIIQTILFVVFALIGLLFLVLIFILGSIFGESNAIIGDILVSGGSAFIGWLVAFVVGIVVSLLLGGIGGFLSAVVYNMAASIAGGLRVRLD